VGAAETFQARQDAGPSPPAMGRGRWTRDDGLSELATVNVQDAIGHGI
jgi:hypothetical protein